MGIVLGLAIGVHGERGLLAGAGWGLISVVCAALLPAVASRPLRRREARSRRTRLAYMSPAVAGAIIGLLILWVTNAPRDIRVVAVGFATGLICSAAVNVFYTSSNHVAALSGGVVLASALLTPWAALLAVMVVALGWSRVQLGAHTTGQAVAGTAVGLISALAVVWWM